MSQIALVPYREFAKLRLERFLSIEVGRHVPIAPLENWEYMGGTWVGSALQFSEFLCPHSRPEELGSLALDAETLPPEAFSAVLTSLHLPVAAGMSVTAIESVLGTPQTRHSFVPGRVTYEYSIGEGERYLVSLTVQETGGLTYVTVIREDILALLQRDA